MIDCALRPALPRIGREHRRSQPKCQTADGRCDLGDFGKRESNRGKRRSHDDDRRLNLRVRGVRNPVDGLVRPPDQR